MRKLKIHLAVKQESPYSWGFFSFYKQIIALEKKQKKTHLLTKQNGQFNMFITVAVAVLSQDAVTSFAFCFFTLICLHCFAIKMSYELHFELINIKQVT